MGTRTATYTQPGPNIGSLAEVRYANFDTPVTFVADANSTTIGINFMSTAHIRYKSTTNSSALPRYNFSNGNLVGNRQFFSVAGAIAAIPEPSSLLFFATTTLGVSLPLLRRRRTA